MSPQKQKTFKNHINKQIRKFRRDLIKLAIENDHPYVMAILEATLNKMRKNIEEGRVDVRPDEYQLTGWDKV